ncbi:molecular chaperone TorD family protein [Oceanisphaera sp. W20_SRM_FM3]|uniref:molecular chaperone TorD family protein n=1 Tax=Oceanisphaera sp. W20_SRM_FM3 TaxID=3240267 RepID=UPI003F9E8D04
MQDFIVTSQRRAELYHWFTALLSAPLTSEELQEFSGYDMHAFLTSLATLDPLHDAAEAFRQQAGLVLALNEPEKQLNGHYQRLFVEQGLLDTSSFTQPSQESLFLMSILLHQHGTQLKDDDPLNVCNQLEMMASLALAATQAQTDEQRIGLLDQQRELANELMLTWLPELVEACAKNDPFGFYQSATQLLLAVFSMDIHYLNNVAP